MILIAHVIVSRDKMDLKFLQNGFDKVYYHGKEKTNKQQNSHCL